MKFLKALASLFAGTCLKQPDDQPDFHRSTSKTARAAILLASRGSITAFELQNILRTTDARNMIHDLRKMGFIHFSEEKTNLKTGARYRVHHWSGKEPTFKA